MNFASVVDKWQQSVSRGDMDAYAALYAPDARLLVPLLSDPLQGREAIKKYETQFSAAFPGATLRLAWRAGRQDVYATEWEYAGKNTGPLAMPDTVLPPTNRHMVLRGVSFLRFNRDGLIVEEHRYYDSRSAFQQLGAAEQGGTEKRGASAGR